MGLESSSDIRPAIPAIFIADAVALDFLNSIATPMDAPVDWIGSGAGFLDWLEQAGLVPADALEHFRAHSRSGEIDRIARQARSLREWFRGFVNKHKGRPLTLRSLRELEPLNSLLQHDDTFHRIALPEKKKSPRLVLETARRWQSPESLLLPVAEALARFLCSQDFSQVKACEGAGCTLLFADHTNGRARRWCSMAICGNRAKQAAHRSRMRAQRQIRADT